MATYQTPTAAFFLTTLLSILLVPRAAVSSPDNVVPELAALRSGSPTGVIRLSDDLLRRILSLPTPRPFHALIFFDAKHLHANSELSLPSLKSEFSLLSSTSRSNNPAAGDGSSPDIFFFSLEFQEAQSSFAVFGISTLPHIRLLPPAAADPKNESIQMEPSVFSGQAESMARFLESRAGISVGPIRRPPPISRKQILVIAPILIVSISYFIRNLIAGNTFLHEKYVWMAGAIFVYFFSVSGVMFNIIRKMPLFLTDRENPTKMVYFYQGSGMQLGAEGFAVGFLYSAVGLLLAFATHVLVKVKNLNLQRAFMGFVLVFSFWAVRKVIFLDNWKTGYGIHGYWPSSWE
ncbi:Probable dolichyl-diphosphooligosaccharide--protein glycosyltransferase subunit 3B [Striga hermonthica]|uniref:Probable dolichyl-diphosphooligosaccharide--protein glycosyltransferase subunit 3B n=1 Tax=Striga hermonthica TaxID=68872 RepID=A0A9N7NBF0_STRHE|nr:Probable dolichyl-diphosphooligosaccharide--protein glycosyltransferase subunit 3B [Striga hermonthica]